MAGGRGIVEVNQRVKPDASLSCAFGRQRCADQSGVSTTLNACQAENVVQMRQAMAAIYQRYGAGYCHDYGRRCQLLDIDMSGMPAGRQGEGSERVFCQAKEQARPTTGPCDATLYDEIVSERLYDGKTQLNRCLPELVAETETVLNLNPGFRQQTILRIDGGGGNDADINHLLMRRYQLLVKVTHWKRVEKLAATVAVWETDPKDPRRQAGWVQEPFAYDQPTRQLAVRCQTKKGTWQTAILVFNLADDQLSWLNQQGKRPYAPPTDPIWRAVYAYDLRGGGVETAIKVPSKGWASSNATKSRSMPGNVAAVGALPTTSLPGCATGWLPVKPDSGSLACCAWYVMPFILLACWLSMQRVISFKFHSIKRII